MTEPEPQKPVSLRIADPTALMEGCELPPEERKAIPAPTLRSPVYRDGPAYLIDITDWLGRDWTLVSFTWTKLQSLLRYFKTLDRQVIKDLFAEIRQEPVPITLWVKRRWKCRKCSKTVKCNPVNKQQWCCPKCQIISTPENAALFTKITPDPPKIQKPPKQKAEPVAEIPPAREAPVVKSSSLADIMKARKAKKDQ